MNTVLPYNFKQHDDGYRFDTDNGLFYSVTFSDGSFYFAELPPHIPVFEVSISTISLGDYLTAPRDPRVEATVVEIFRLFFLDHENSIIYVCDNLDHKQAARHRKFDMWFRRHAIKELEKYDTHFLVESLEIYASLILHSDNAYKDELIKVFLSQANEYDK
jgi:hypothetical protein